MLATVGGEATREASSEMCGVSWSAHTMHNSHTEHRLEMQVRMQAEVGVKYYHFDPLCENEFLFSRREVKT